MKKIQFCRLQNKTKFVFFSFFFQSKSIFTTIWPDVAKSDTLFLIFPPTTPAPHAPPFSSFIFPAIPLAPLFDVSYLFFSIIRKMIEELDLVKEKKDMIHQIEEQEVLQEK